MDKLRNLTIHEQNQKLMMAVKKGKKEEVIEILNGGADVNYLDSSGCTPLAHVAKTKNIEIIECLLAYGADINKAGTNGYTPLQRATESNYEYKQVVQYLIEKGANINGTTPNGYTPLTYLVSQKNIISTNYLISEGADVNECEENGKSPLSRAVVWCRHDEIKFLLNQGANINAIDADGNTALANAVKVSAQDVVQNLLARGADICKSGKNGKTPLSMAVLYKDLVMVKFLVDNGAQRTIQSAFLDAIQRGNLAVVEYMKEKGALVNHIYRNGKTPLRKAFLSGAVDIARYLIDNGADKRAAISAVNENSILIRLMEDKKFEMVKFLILIGAKVDVIGKCGYTPLTKTVEMENFTLMKYLIEQGADINLVDNNQKCPLLIAASNHYFQIVAYLIDQGANIDLAKKKLEEYASWNDDIDLLLKSPKKIVPHDSGQEEA